MSPARHHAGPSSISRTGRVQCLGVYEYLIVNVVLAESSRWCKPEKTVSPPVAGTQKAGD